MLFAAFNVFTGDKDKLRTQVLVWTDALEDRPMWAIQKAYKYASRVRANCRRLPSFSVT